MKNAVLFNYYIGDSTFGGVIAYIDDRETAKKFASDIEVGMSYALYEQDFRHLFNVARTFCAALIATQISSKPPSIAKTKHRTCFMG